MKSGMDRKTACKYRTLNQLPSDDPAPHTWRTRPDPLAAVWPRLEELLQAEPRLQAKTLFDWLQREYPSQDWHCHRRTALRRVRTWKAQHGSAKEVFFSQVHEAGRLGSSDFTHMGSLNITLQGQPFDHLLYHFVLTHSNWEDVTLCCSESFASLSEGLQNALWQLGGVPRRHRTDRMTLAVHHDGHPEQFTANYQALMRHYGITAEATNPASGHENGDCEQGHRRFKERVEQELLLRGSRDFSSREQYVQFLRTMVARGNLGRQEKFANEQPQLQRLPKRRLETMERQRVRVGQGSTIQVKKNIYSVPSRMIGESVDKDAVKVGLTRCLQELRLATMRTQHEAVAAQAVAESWSYEKFLLELLERECQQRQHNRIERLLRASRLPLEKSWSGLELKRLPAKAVQQLRGLLNGEFLDRRENVLVFGPPGSGQTHALCGLTQELARSGRSVLFTKCSILVQELLTAKRDLALKGMLRDLSKWEALVIDDLGYVQQSREEMEVLFTLLAERYERGSVLATSNLAFSQWEQIFKDPMTTAAAIDRLVHHAVIVEVNVPSYRAEQARKAKHGRSTDAGEAGATAAPSQPG